MNLRNNQIKELDALLVELKSEYLELEKQNKIHSLGDLSISINAILHFNSDRYLYAISTDSLVTRTKVLKSVLKSVKDFNKKGLAC